MYDIASNSATFLADYLPNYSFIPFSAPAEPWPMVPSERHFQTSAAVSDLFKISYWRIRSEEPETLFLPAPDLFSMMHQKIGIFSGLKNSEYQKNTWFT